MDPTTLAERVILDSSATHPELDEAWHDALTSGLSALFESVPPMPLAPDSPFLTGGTTSLGETLAALGSQVQRVAALETILVRLWGEFTTQRETLREAVGERESLAERNRGLQAQLAERPVAPTGQERGPLAESLATMVEKHRELDARLESVAGILSRVRGERDDADRECSGLRLDIEAYDIVLNALGMPTLRRKDLIKVMPAVVNMAPRIQPYLPAELRLQSIPPPEGSTAPPPATATGVLPHPVGRAVIGRAGPSLGYAPPPRPEGPKLSPDEEMEITLLLQQVRFPPGWDFILRRVWSQELGRDGNLEVRVAAAPVTPVRSIQAPLGFPGGPPDISGLPAASRAILLGGLDIAFTAEEFRRFAPLSKAQLVRLWEGRENHRKRRRTDGHRPAGPPPTGSKESPPRGSEGDAVMAI
jgi:hypothetical protein